VAKFKEWTTEQRIEWEEWLKDRPYIIKELAKRFPPNELFLLKTTGQRVYLMAYSEDNTVTVAITGDFNKCLFDKSVFGINPDDLEPCDIPDPKTVGCLYKTEIEQQTSMEWQKYCYDNRLFNKINEPMPYAIYEAALLGRPEFNENAANGIWE